MYIYRYIYKCTNNYNRQISPAAGSAGQFPKLGKCDQRDNIDCVVFVCFFICFYIADDYSARNGAKQHKPHYELPISCSLGSKTGPFMM